MVTALLVIGSILVQFFFLPSVIPSNVRFDFNGFFIAVNTGLLLGVLFEIRSLKKK
jgi:hypothetical protein